MSPAGDIQTILGPLALIILGLISLALTASLAEELRDILASLAGLCFGLTARIQRALAAVITWLRDWSLAQVANEHGSQGGGPMYYIIGATISTMITILLIAADLGVITLTVQTLGFEETNIDLHFDSTLVISISIICSAIFWCIVLFDVAGVTHLGPWGRLRGNTFFGSWIVWCALAGLAIALLIVTLMSGIRIEALDQWAQMNAGAPAFTGGGVSDQEVSLRSGGVMLGDGDTASGSAEAVIPFKAGWKLKVCMMAISFLSLFTSAFSAVSLGMFLKFLILVLAMIACLPVGAIFLVVWVINTIGNAFFTMIRTLLELTIALGQIILFPFQPLLAWIGRKSTGAPHHVPNTDQLDQEPDAGPGSVEGHNQGPEPQNAAPGQTQTHTNETSQDEPQAQKDPGFNPFGGGNQ